AIVKVHGGAWIQGSRSGHSDWNRWLNRLGYVVFDIEYALPPHADWRSEVADVKCALRWVRSHASTYHVDPSRISTMGYSAGGNLAMLAAYAESDPRLPASCGTSPVAVRSVINLYGPTDLTQLFRASGSRAYIDRALERYIGGTPSAFPGRYRALSPISHVTARTPPTITLIGGSDRIVPVEQARVLDAALARAGVPHPTYVLPATDHGFDVDWHGLATQLARGVLQRFLARYG
ncbi:MAG: alpha/beta hydrolase, partial [Gaiellales bacterium]